MIAAGVGLFSILFVLAALASARKQQMASTLPQVLLRLGTDPDTTPEALVKGAAEAEALGFPKFAGAMREKARGKISLKFGKPKIVSRVRGESERARFVSETEPNANTQKPVRGIPSPFPNVPHDAWTKFVMIMGRAKSGTVSPKGHLGIFQMGMRRFADLGLAKNVRKGERNGEQGVWLGIWNAPLSEAKFLGSPELQYKVFTRSMQSYKNEIAEKFGNAIGQEFEGKPATLSGLLAVAHHAGTPGLAKWLTGTPPRDKFPQTTAAYKAATGIF